MALVFRPAGYTGTLQQITWTQGDNVPVTAYLWGGGGGSGGSSYSGAAIGGAGGGGQFSQVNFTINNGDVLEVAVGGPGQGGDNYSTSAAGGSPGASLLVSEIFNTRTATPVSGPGGPVLPQFNSRYCTFLNVNGVWINPSSAGVFDKTYSVTFPESGNYQFQASADNSAKFYFDDTEVFTAFDYGTTYEIGYPVTAGTYNLRIVGTNTGGPGAVALTITRGSSYSGGRGGNSSTESIIWAITQASGGGGGGGGGTVLILNNTVIGVAGGGGGGGGASWATGSGQSAPGSSGQATPGQTAGQNGTTPLNYTIVNGSGGGGGGGGGGAAGGNGGYTPQAGVSSAGSYGGGLGIVSNPAGRLPGGTDNQYWVPSVGYGGRQRAYGPSETGNGVSGYAMFVFDVNGIWVNQSGQGWQQTRDAYAKVNNTWNKVQGVWIKEAGVWEPVISSYAPDWVPISGRYGINPRAAAPDLTPLPPPPPAGGYEPGGYDGGGGGGSCFLAGTAITMADGSVKSIEDIVIGDMILEALTNKPTRVIGVKTRAHDVSKWVFSLDKKVKPYITEEHPFYNDNNELCAISDLATTLAPWLGTIKIVDVPNKKKIKEAVTVYNLMLETGESHYANGVRVNNIVKTGGTYALVYKGFLDKASYESYVYNEENQTVNPEQQALIFNYTLKLTNYVLQNNNITSKLLGRFLSWALKNRDTLYPYIDRWFKSKLRGWLFGKNT
jgi:hypothetical protein